MGIYLKEISMVEQTIWQDENQAHIPLSGLNCDE